MNVMSNLVIDTCQTRTENPQAPVGPIWEPMRIEATYLNMHKEPTIMKQQDFYYIYCYTHNITIDNTEYKCPLTPFKLESETPFNIGNLTQSKSHINITAERRIYNNNLTLKLEPLPRDIEMMKADQKLEQMQMVAALMGNFSHPDLGRTNHKSRDEIFTFSSLGIVSLLLIALMLHRMLTPNISDAIIASSLLSINRPNNEDRQSGGINININNAPEPQYSSKNSSLRYPLLGSVPSFNQFQRAQETIYAEPKYTHLENIKEYGFPMHPGGPSFSIEEIELSDLKSNLARSVSTPDNTTFKPGNKKIRFM